MKTVIKEGRWDCRYCGHRGNRGPEKYCSACGAARDKTVQFYLPSDARTVSDESEIRVARSGPDWVCPACGADNRVMDSSCSGCGYSASGAEQRTTKSIRAVAEPLKKSKPVSKRGLFTLLSIILVVAGFFYWANRTHVEVLVATEFSWERTLQLEHYVTEVESGWEGELPGGARVLSKDYRFKKTRKVLTGYRDTTRQVTKRVQVGTQKVKVGTKDLGNGYFEEIYREEPIYRDKEVTEPYREPIYRHDKIYANYCTYEIDRWRKADPRTVSGKSKTTYWPADIENLGTKTRIYRRRQSYRILFKNESGDERILEVSDEKRWQAFVPNEAYEGRVNNLGNVVEIPIG